jgi:hypothetical protein
MSGHLWHALVNRVSDSLWIPTTGRRYRESWTGKIILQVEEKQERNSEVHVRWRDATIEDIRLIELQQSLYYLDGYRMGNENDRTTLRGNP